MPSSSNYEDNERLKGFVTGKRVWLAEHTFEGALLAKRYAEYNVNLRIADHRPDAWGRLFVTLGDGSQVRIRKDLLRLTPPPGTTVKRETVKETKAKPRKEAVDPKFGTETTVFDALEGT